MNEALPEDEASRRRAPRWVGALLALAALAAPQAGRAAGPYDPEVPYLTLTTPRFLVSFPEGYGHIALRAADIAESAYPYMVRRYGWAPAGRISLIINDQTDFANGSATIVPNKVITVYVTAPTKVSGLEEYDDWLSTVIIHEMAHIFHLDMAFGLPWVGRLLFGKYVSMNMYNPAWVTEGLAVYEETVSSGSGRGRSTYVEMVLRAAALEDRFPSIDQGLRGYPHWPFSNIAYFFGGRFQLWLAERYGEEKLLEYHRTYATNPVPYVTAISAKLVFGETMEALWDAFAAEVKEDAERQAAIIARGPLPVTEPVRLTRHGGECLGPRITPDGQHVLYSTSSPVDGPRVRRMRLDGSGDEVLVNDTLSEAISFDPQGTAFYFQQAEINQRFYAHNSLLRYDIRRESFARMKLAEGADKKEFLAPSGSLRARDPDLSPDGELMVFVQSPYGANRLVLAEVEADGVSLTPRVLVPAEPDVEFSGPRFSPDGQRVAVSRFKGGRRDIVLYDLEGRVTELTRDRAQDTDPTWSKDGRYLVFVSDRAGAYNLYAYDLEAAELRQLTNVVTGAFQPSVSPDGATVVFRGYSADGFDVYATRFDPAAGLVVPLELEPTAERDIRERAWPPMRAGVPQIPPPAPFKDTPLPEALPEGWSIEPYSALSTLLPFNDNWNLFPSLQANEREIFGSLTHFGADARETHKYLLNVTYGSLTNFVGGAAGYSYDVLEPTFTVFGSANAVSYGGALLTEQSPAASCPHGDQPLDLEDGRRICYGAPGGIYNERQLRGALSIGLPVLQRHFISLSYIWEHRQALDPLPARTIASILPRAGNFSRVQLGYTYANVRAFPYSISLERGPSFSMALSALSKGLGGDYEEFLFSTEGRYYLDLPWRIPGLTNHVLATRLGFGFGLGPDRARTFRLGGVAGSSALTTTTDDFFGLRGLGLARLRGSGVVSGSTEYRAPLFRVDRGVGTLPFALRVVHAAAFADYGRVFSQLDADLFTDGFLDAFAVGVGGEVRADVILFWALPLSLRLGYAVPVKVPASSDPGLRAPGLYFQLGSLF